MKLSFSLVIFLATTLTSTAIGQTIRFADGPGGNSGGEFRARIAGVTPHFTAPLAGSAPGGSGGSEFMTFCIELGEFLDFSNAFDYSLGSSSIGGGVGGGSPDLLAQQSAYLYRLFATGSLSSYDYTGGTRANSANALQALFWTIEGEVTYNSTNGEFRRSDNNALVGTLSAAEQGLYTTWNSLAFSNTEDYGVRVVNATLNNNNAQSVLVLIPLPPAAWAGIGTLGGLAVLGSVRRRRNERAGV